MRIREAALCVQCVFFFTFFFMLSIALVGILEGSLGRPQPGSRAVDFFFYNLCRDV